MLQFDFTIVEKKLIPKDIAVDSVSTIENNLYYIYLYIIY